MHTWISPLWCRSLSGQLIVFETLAALSYAFVLRESWSKVEALIGMVLLIAGVVWAIRNQPPSAAPSSHAWGSAAQKPCVTFPGLGEMVRRAAPRKHRSVCMRASSTTRSPMPESAHASSPPDASSLRHGA